MSAFKPGRVPAFAKKGLAPCRRPTATAQQEAVNKGDPAAHDGGPSARDGAPVVRDGQAGPQAGNEPPAKRPKLRDDHPEVRNATRGSRQEALRIVSNPVLAEQAAAELELHFYANSSRDSRCSLLRTYCDLAAAAGLTPFPMAKKSARLVFGALRKARYRNVPLYLARARQRHSELNYEVDEALALYFQGVARSTDRGLGAADRAAAIDLATLARMIFEFAWFFFRRTFSL